MVFSINDAIKLSNSYAPINVFTRPAKHFGFFFISEQSMSTRMDNKYECNYFLSTAVSGSDSGSGVIFVDSSEFETVDLEGVRQTRASSSSDSLSKAVSSNITNIPRSRRAQVTKTPSPVMPKR